MKYRAAQWAWVRKQPSTGGLSRDNYANRRWARANCARARTAAHRHFHIRLRLLGIVNTRQLTKLVKYFSQCNISPTVNYPIPADPAKDATIARDVIEGQTSMQASRVGGRRRSWRPDALSGSWERIGCPMEVGEAMDHQNL
ncbi:hypothetical protein EVAR_85648_1 [Eumeta japonica]|uniref:Uncharacterized protein n=1 Tax=Eumeta variegata TaxID=151549 RepID=A0A4C1XRJ8_EUMVA|nr:hypothetical protein EVAR_85648_1 [Eumeta japonica]